MTIEVIPGPSGKPIPAQRVRTVYVAQRDLTGEIELAKDERLVDVEVYVSHFETCPYADRFSGKR